MAHSRGATPARADPQGALAGVLLPHLQAHVGDVIEPRTRSMPAPFFLERPPTPPAGFWVDGPLPRYPPLGFLTIPRLSLRRSHPLLK